MTRERETEWKFLVTRLPALPAALRTELIEQGYFNAAEAPAVRVRMRGSESTLEVKVGGGRRARGPKAALEYRYEIPAGDARELLAAAPWVVRKVRHHLAGGIELDVFEGPLAGLVLAELEVETEGEPPSAPAGWEWRDVSHDARFSNRGLAEHGVPEGTPLLSP